jgi:hypothetical protein
MCGVSSYQGCKYGWHQHASIYRKRKRTKTDTLVDTEKSKGINQARTGG